MRSPSQRAGRCGLQRQRPLHEATREASFGELHSIPTVNRFGHIDLRVSDIGEAVGFYEALLPALGFTRRFDGETWRVWAAEDPLPATAYFGITEDQAH